MRASGSMGLRAAIGACAGDAFVSEDVASRPAARGTDPLRCSPRAAVARRGACGTVGAGTRGTLAARTAGAVVTAAAVAPVGMAASATGAARVTLAARGGSSGAFDTEAARGAAAMPAASQPSRDTLRPRDGREGVALRRPRAGHALGRGGGVPRRLALRAALPALALGAGPKP